MESKSLVAAAAQRVAAMTTTTEPTEIAGTEDLSLRAITAVARAAVIKMDATKGRTMKTKIELGTTKDAVPAIAEAAAAESNP